MEVNSGVCKGKQFRWTGGTRNVAFNKTFNISILKG